jgi:predicted alpha/beta-hydrolase family hydrolase
MAGRRFSNAVFGSTTGEEKMPIEFIFNGPADAQRVFALAHGAGVAMDAPFMNYFAEQLGAAGIRVARFEFPYMIARRKTGKQLPPDSTSKLCASWRAAIAQLACPSLVIGGKSLGGRVASMIADAEQVAGLICLGYPFHPPAKPQQTRTDHLQNLKTPTLILQGTRDPFGNQDEVATYQLASTIRIAWLDDGDHSFVPRKKSGVSADQNLKNAADQASEFILQLK